VHTFESLQLGAGPPTHVPDEQVSEVVHAFASSQGPVLFVNTQPDAALHVSFVQTLASPQTTEDPDTQIPPWQVSAGVNTRPAHAFTGWGQLAAVVHSVQPGVVVP
jgi:hypothetical protein